MTESGKSAADALKSARQSLAGLAYVLLAHKPIGAGWDAIAAAIDLPGADSTHSTADFDALYQPVPLPKRKRKKRPGKARVQV